ncbi:ribosome modulation factor [Arthrobacter pigmenti]
MSESGRKVVIDAQLEGYRAYLSGQAATENPKSRDDPDQRQAWYRGYASARTDRARANKTAANDS